MPDRSKIRPRDPNQLAYRIIQEATGQVPPKYDPNEVKAKPVDPAKNPNAVALGRLGGLKGGAARAASLSPKKRSQIAAKAAKARWGKEAMSAPDPKLIELYTSLGLWIESVSIRLSAQESVLKREFGITDEQWTEALAKARDEFRNRNRLRRTLLLN